MSAAQAQVQQAQARIEQANAEIKNAQASPQQVAATKAKAIVGGCAGAALQGFVEQAQLNLQYTTIVAPVDGIGGKRSVQAGQTFAGTRT